MILTPILLTSLVQSIEGKRDVWTYIGNNDRLDSKDIKEYYTSLARGGASHILAGTLVAVDRDEEIDRDDRVGPLSGSRLIKEWASLSSTEKCDIAIELHNEGTRLLLVTDSRNGVQGYLHYSPETWSDIVCKHAHENSYDGIDIHVGRSPLISDMQAFTSWAIKASRYCRNYINYITHSPKAAYFSNAWGHIYDSLTKDVDALLVHFFDHGALSYNNYYTTWVEDPTWPSWLSLKVLSQDLGRKAVVTKWIYSGEGFGGGVHGRFTVDQLVSGLKQAEASLNYTAGVAVWNLPAPSSRHYATFINEELPRLSRDVAVIQ